MADTNTKCCCPPPCPGPGKDPFPAMSAHFAHTLDDMREQYLQAQYIDIESETGVLDADKLEKLLLSRTNMLVYQNRVFRFSSQEGYICKYINVYKLDADESYKVQLIVVSTLTGAWNIIDIDPESKEAIDTLKEDVTLIQNDVANLSDNVTNLDTKVENITYQMESGFDNINELLDQVDVDLTDVKDKVADLTTRVDDIGEYLKLDGGELEV